MINSILSCICSLGVVSQRCSRLGLMVFPKATILVDTAPNTSSSGSSISLNYAAYDLVSSMFVVRESMCASLQVKKSLSKPAGNGYGSCSYMLQEHDVNIGIISF